MASDTGSFGIIDQDYASTLESVDFVEADILKAAAEAGFGEDDQHGIGMAVRECMVNAVVHGNRYNKNKHVHVNVTRSGTEFTIRIVDQGEGFEAERVPDPLDDTNILRHSGRGLFLMSAFMDDVKVKKASPNGTEVTLVKEFGPQK
jgi:serine/threonine-protein kinase RsbW